MKTGQAAYALLQVIMQSSVFTFWVNSNDLSFYTLRGVITLEKSSTFSMACPVFPYTPPERLFDVAGMDYDETFKASEVPNVDRQKLCHFVNIHACSEACIVDSDPFDLIFHQENTPAVVHRPAVWEKFKILFYLLRDKVCFGDGQPEPILVRRPSGNVPKLA
jgi:hypothetical protein